MLPLDAGAASPPSWKRTWFVALVLSFIKRKKDNAEDGPEGSEEDTDASQAVTGNKKQRKAAKRANKQREGMEDTSESEAVSSGAATPVGSGPSGKLQMQPTIMAGGRRRKAMPRKVPNRKGKEQEQDGSEQS